MKINGKIGNISYETPRKILTGRLFAWTDTVDYGIGPERRKGRVVSDENGYACSCGQYKRLRECQHVKDVFDTLVPLSELDYR